MQDLVNKKRDTQNAKTKKQDEITKKQEEIQCAHKNARKSLWRELVLCIITVYTIWLLFYSPSRDYYSDIKAVIILLGLPTLLISDFVVFLCLLEGIETKEKGNKKLPHLYDEYSVLDKHVKDYLSKISEAERKKAASERRITALEEKKKQLEAIFPNGKPQIDITHNLQQTSQTELKEGNLIYGRVSRITKFGAFVELAPEKEGMVHISKLADHMVSSVEEIVKIGDMIWVKITDIDDKGRINLSHVDAVREIQNKYKKE